MMPADGLKTLESYDSILFGAVGFPPVPDHISLWGLLLPLRQYFDQYINLRPVRLLAAFPARCATRARQISISSASARTPRASTPAWAVASTGAWRTKSPCRPACLRATAWSACCAMALSWRARRPRHELVSATKSNALQYSMVFWDEVFRGLQAEYPEVACRQYHVDALAARMITAPESLDVVVASNLFGDILTDLGGALAGQPGHPAQRQHQPRETLSVAV